MIPADPPDASRPLLVSGLRAAAIGNGSGELTLLRETRGGPVEWGGVYAEGIRLTGPWSVRIVQPSGETTLSESVQEIRVTPTGISSTHTVGAITVLQRVAPVEEAAGVSAIGRRLELVSHAPQPLPVRVETMFSPFLAPVLLEGVKPYEYHVSTRGPDLAVESHGFAFSVHSDPLPHHLCLDRASWIGGKAHREVTEILLDYDLVLAPGAPTSLNWLVAGGLERSLPGAAASAPSALSVASEWSARAEARFAEWESGRPHLELPGLPVLEDGFRLACGALRQLYKSAEPDLEGLVAGFPWYASFWGRDLAWMLPAVLWLGDAGRAEHALETLFRYQARHTLPMLGASEGEIPMQVTAGPIFLFGTSDTSLYYPDLVRRLLEHTGDSRPLEGFGAALDRISAWATAKLDPSTGLLCNGGEVALIRSATDEAGAVHFGFDAVDTTIWDSTDRRDHAIDVQVLYVQMLEALARLAPLRGRDADARELAERAGQLRRGLPALYAWPEETYLADSRTRAGAAVRRVRPNALRMVSAGWLPAETARAVVDRAGRDDLATPWGLRTLSSRDPGYDPEAYHDGQVWPIATAWAAEAALAVGDTATGLRYLTLIAGRIREEHGLANECYRGDRPEPFDSCFLLGFSVAPFLTTIFERLWGIRPRLLERTVSVDPQLPEDIGPARLTNLSLGGGRLDLAVVDRRLEASWRGPFPLRVECRGTLFEIADGATGSIDLGPAKSS